MVRGRSRSAGRWRLSLPAVASPCALAGTAGDVLADIVATTGWPPAATHGEEQDPLATALRKEAQRAEPKSSRPPHAARPRSLTTRNSLPKTQRVAPLRLCRSDGRRYGVLLTLPGLLRSSSSGAPLSGLERRDLHLQA